MKDSKITAELLREAVVYEPETGRFFRKVASGFRGRHKAGVELKARQPHGYVRFSVCGEDHYAHRLAWLYMTGEWPRQHIDHMNGDRADNRFCNLRDVPQRTNRENRIVAKKNSSTGVLGVSFDRKTNAFRVQIKSGPRRVNLRCKTLEDAAKKYLELKCQIHQGFVLDRVVKS